MKSKDFLLTVAVSVATTLAITEMSERPTIDQLLAADQESVRELTVDRLIVREELVVSDTGEPWEKGFEQHQIPRGAVIRQMDWRQSSGKNSLPVVSPESSGTSHGRHAGTGNDVGRRWRLRRRGLAVCLRSPSDLGRLFENSSASKADGAAIGERR